MTAAARRSLGRAVNAAGTYGEADDTSPMYSSLRLAREPEEAAEDGRIEARTSSSSSRCEPTWPSCRPAKRDAAGAAGEKE
jgi:hypothetical protein